MKKVGYGITMDELRAYHPPDLIAGELERLGITKALIVKKEWLDKIFDEGKIWEMRTTRTKVRGKIGLIESGTGMIVGEVVLIGCYDDPIPKHKDLIFMHKIEDLDLLDKWEYAWVLLDAKRYDKPIPYKHPRGAVIWVNLTNDVLPIVIGSSIDGETIEGITKGCKYLVTYEGKDEIEVINDFGEKSCYSKNCFENYK